MKIPATMVFTFPQATEIEWDRAVVGPEPEGKPACSESPCGVPKAEN